MNSKSNGRFPWEKNEKMKSAGYARDLDATRGLPYAEKFADFFQLCEKAKKKEFQVVIAAFPEILGDNYEELVSNLWMCAKADLLVAFANKNPEESPCE